MKIEFWQKQHAIIIWLIFECKKKLLHTFCNVLTLSGLLQAIQDWRHALQSRQSIDTHCFFKYKFSRLIKGPSITNNSLWHLYAVVAYAIVDAVFHHRASCFGVTHPSSFHLEPEFSRWISSSSLFLFSTLYSPCKSSQSLSPPRLLRCDLVGKSWLRPAATGFSIFLVLMSEQCPFILMCMEFLSPTYCRPHFLHCIK